VEQEIKTPEEAVQNTRRIGLVILAVLLLLLAVGGIVLKIALTPDDAFERILHETVYDYDEDADMTYFITDGKLMDAVMEGYVIESASDADGSVTAVLNCTNELFILKDKKLTKAAGGVVEFRLAAAGTAAAYIQEDGTTALYDITRGTSRIIEASRWCGSLTLSPDGGTLMLLRESELGTDVLCIWRDGTLTELAAHALPIAVSDDARYAYYRGASDNSLYVSRKLGEPVRLTENFDNMTSFCFDRELEEFFFSTWDGLFVSVKGREPVQVYDMSVGLQLLCPPRTAVTTLSGYVRADIYPVKTFAGQPVLFEMLGRESKDLVYLDEEYQQQFKLEAWDFTLTPDNRTLYYLRGPELYGGYGDAGGLGCRDVRRNGHRGKCGKIPRARLGRRRILCHLRWRAQPYGCRRQVPRAGGGCVRLLRAGRRADPLYRAVKGRRHGALPRGRRQGAHRGGSLPDADGL